MSDSKTVLLRMKDIKKSFSHVPALKGVELELKAGEIHALVGENGAGKSTLIKILTGAYKRDTGGIEFLGGPVAFRSPKEAQDAGIVAVYQEVNLLHFRTVAENIFLGREPRRFGIIQKKLLREQTRAVLSRLGIDVDPDAPVGSLNIAHRQMVAIARAVSVGAKVLVLDEPTSSLTETEVGLLFEVMRRLKAEGTAILYVSHRFDELYAICDKVTVFRDGRNVLTAASLATLDRLDLVCHMLGRKRDDLRRGVTAFTSTEVLADGKPVLLAAEGINSGARLEDVCLEVRRGEIVGLAGLLGSGRTETARALFGADRMDAGKILFEGKPLTLRGPDDAIEAGLAFLPEDRKHDGIIPELSVRENLTLAALPSLTKWGVVSRKEQEKIVERFMRRLGIKAASAEQPISELSGGNQQKVLLARWLCMNTKILLLDEPTRGIDVGAKAEIQHLIAELAAQGLGVLMISSEVEELVEGSQRVVVMRDGKSVAELKGAKKTAASILQVMAEGSVGKEKVA